MAAPERPSHAKHLHTRVQHLWAMSYHFGGIQRVRGEPLPSVVKLVSVCDIKLPDCTGGSDGPACW